MFTLIGIEDYLSISLIPIIVLLIIVISWMSTFVREQPIISATFVVVQDERTSTPSTHSYINPNTDTHNTNNQRGTVNSAQETVPKMDKNESSVKAVSENNSANDENLSNTPESMFEEPQNHLQADESSELPTTSGQIKIRLMFLDESQKVVHGQLSDEIGSFKREHFSMELSSNCTVKLIFNGQLLSRESCTLEQYGLFNNCVVHCHVSEPNTQHVNVDQVESQDTDLDLSEFLVPMLIVITGGLWFIRYQYSSLFNSTATLILIVISLLILIPNVNIFSITVSNILNNSFGRDRQEDSNSSSNSSSEGDESERVYENNIVRRRTRSVEIGAGS